MADPTIQTFCCHIPNKTSSSVSMLIEFHSESYNSLCVASSVFGVIGAIYQILPKKQRSSQNRQYSFYPVRGRRIIIWLAIADLLASLGVFARSLIWIINRDLIPAISNSVASVAFCAVSSAWIEYFYMATWFWTLCYAIDMRWMLKAQREMKRDTGHAMCYHLTSWLCPAVLTLFGLAILYIPDANCHTVATMPEILLHILPNYCTTFLPLAVIMIANPILYCQTSQDAEYSIGFIYRQYTDRERKAVEAIKWKFCFFTVVFYFCWLPNLICGILIWALWINLPRGVIITLWYTMAVMNPLQAFFNSFLYRKWNTNQDITLPKIPWSRRVMSPNQTPTGFMRTNKRLGIIENITPSVKSEERDLWLFKVDEP